MGRFALEPRSLLWLPPTMAPCPTSTVEGYLEYPTEAFEDFRRSGVDRVVCEEKHMGSRGVALVRRDGTGVLYTRTGRAFFTDDALNGQVVARLAAAIEAAGLFDELATDWVLLDSELLPWSAKALGLITDQYASVGAAARQALPAVLAVLESAAARGLPVADVRDRTAQRLDHAEGFAAAYRRYCWPTAGLSGVKIAPFVVLASAGRHYAAHDHGWHLDVADRLVAADPDFIAPTERRVVDLADADQVADAAEWWLRLTGAGGEGMVVKPFAGLVRSGSGVVQPGLKVRGREYLRIIYGPDYTLPDQLARLRQRRTGRKRALALREYALGLAALDLVAGGAPLWRVHEAVFAILACESEPVDPRL
jgi:hypothetical protein